MLKYEEKSPKYRGIRSCLEQEDPVIIGQCLFFSSFARSGLWATRTEGVQECCDIEEVEVAIAIEIGARIVRRIRREEC